jgi:hypothetical protein
MRLYAAIDLHSNNSVLCVLDETDHIVFAKRLPNELATIETALRGCAGEVHGVAIESTYNWYWLVDGLQDAGFTVHLVNTTAVKQYDGLKHCGDFDDARHLAHLLRLGILPTGYIYPREERASVGSGLNTVRIKKNSPQYVLPPQRSGAWREPRQCWVRAPGWPTT